MTRTITVNTQRHQAFSILAALTLALSLLISACGPSDDGGITEPTATSSALGSIGESGMDSARESTSTEPSPTSTPRANNQDQEQSRDADVTPPLTPEPTARAEKPSIVLPTPRTIERTPAPVHLRIPKIGIDATVQWVGADESGQMGVPSNYTDVAWYEVGPPPGTPGNAVIAGHLDSTTGPAIFFRLEELQPGDEIFVGNEAGQELRFVVGGSEVYDAANAPLERIFGPAINPQLNLITCDGAFDQSARQYDKRLVIFTSLSSN